jgi:hypothetical protein
METKELFDTLLRLPGYEKLLIVQVINGVPFGLVIEKAKKHRTEEKNAQEENKPVTIFHLASYGPVNSKIQKCMG